MTQETLMTVAKLMRDKGYVATFEYPNSVQVSIGGHWTAVLGGVNEFISFDVVESDSSELVGSRESTIPSKSEDAVAIAEWFAPMLECPICHEVGGSPFCERCGGF